MLAGLPHSEIHGSKLVRSSPWLIAAYHVFHRLSAPRHPPNTLKALDRSHYRCPRPRQNVHSRRNELDNDRKTIVASNISGSAAVKLSPQAGNANRAKHHRRHWPKPDRRKCRIRLESRICFLFTMSDNSRTPCCARRQLEFLDEKRFAPAI